MASVNIGDASQNNELTKTDAQLRAHDEYDKSKVSWSSESKCHFCVLATQNKMALIEEALYSEMCVVGRDFLYDFSSTKSPTTRKRFAARARRGPRYSPRPARGENSSMLLDGLFRRKCATLLGIERCRSNLYTTENDSLRKTCSLEDVPAVDSPPHSCRSSDSQIHSSKTTHDETSEVTVFKETGNGNKFNSLFDLEVGCSNEHSSDEAELEVDCLYEDFSDEAKLEVDGLYEDFSEKAESPDHTSKEATKNVNGFDWTERDSALEYEKGNETGDVSEKCLYGCLQEEPCLKPPADEFKEEELCTGNIDADSAVLTKTDMDETAAAGSVSPRCEETTDCGVSSDAGSDDSYTFSKYQSILFFDWDDTLLPSTWLSSRNLSLEENCVVPDSLKPTLDEMAECARKTLELASELGVVIIVTNAETGWVQLSCSKFMPSLLPHLVKYKQLSARSSYETPENKSPFTWKQLAFRNEIIIHYDKMPKSLRKNIMSFGDSTHERLAIMTITRVVPTDEDGCLQLDNSLTISDCDPCPHLINVVGHFRTKSIKFLERPDIENLKKEHSLIASCLRQISQTDCDMDLVIQRTDIESPVDITPPAVCIPPVVCDPVTYKAPAIQNLCPSTKRLPNYTTPYKSDQLSLRPPAAILSNRKSAPVKRRNKLRSSAWMSATAQRKSLVPLLAPSTMPQPLQSCAMKSKMDCAHPHAAHASGRYIHSVPAEFSAAVDATSDNTEIRV